MKFDSLRLLQMQSFGVLVEQNLNGQQFYPAIGDNLLKFGSPSASTMISKPYSGRSMGISGKLKVSEGDTEMRASGFASSPCNITHKMVTTNTESSTVIASANPVHHAFDIDWLNNIPDLDNLSMYVMCLNLLRLYFLAFQLSSFVLLMHMLLDSTMICNSI